MRDTFGKNGHEHSSPCDSLRMIGGNILEKHLRWDFHETRVSGEKLPAIAPSHHRNQDADRNADCDPAAIVNLQQVGSQE